MKQDANAVTLEYVNRWGDHHTLALYRDSYAMGGGFAISALDATDPADSEYLSPWSDITVNIPDNPDAAWWCATDRSPRSPRGRWRPWAPTRRPSTG